MANIYSNNTTAALPAVSWPNRYVNAFFKKRWLYHSVFWLVYYSAFSLIIVWGVYRIYDPLFYLQLIPIYALETAMIYFNFYVLMPRLLMRRKYAYYALALLATIVCMGFVNVCLKHVYAQHGSKLYAITADFTFANLVGSISERLYAILLTGVIKIAKDALQNQQRMREREKQFLQTELNFLKSQIQPHFFFNTLNNLYSLTLKKSDQAPEVVLKLSELMSYMLYETNAPLVPLDKEINYLQNYIALESLRFGKNLTLHFDIEGQTESIYVPPLVLILFIENSFKHGARNSANHLSIDISMRITNGFLMLSVQNPYNENATAKSKTGLGLKNARRRLQLLYNDNYSIDETKAGQLYTVYLKIPV